MWLRHCAFIFWMKLNANKPWMRRKLNNLNQSGIGIYPSSNHSRLFYFKFKRTPDQTVTELFGHNVDSKWANILYVGQIPEKDILILEKNLTLMNRVKKTIDDCDQIQFKNELFSITKII